MERPKDDGYASLLMELFSSEFLAELPKEQIDSVMNTLRLMEESDEGVPDQWQGLKKVLIERGYLV